ncbi:LPXTG cell wall anchor domain-containing protein [Lactococcus lactis subsp. lactis]|nr:LPXTG cell wall anchor domain-containing protein [Lactococcus lactis subsp. lactis]
MKNKIYFSGTVIQPLEDAPTATGTVKVNYIDEQGNEISSSQSVSGSVGENYDVGTDQYKLDIRGYTFKEIQGNVTGTFSEQPQNVSYVYSKNPVVGGDVTVKYVDTEGNKISDDIVKTGNVGDVYTTDQKIIDAHTFQEVKGNASVTFTEQAQNVTYIYSKNKAELKVHDSDLYVGDTWTAFDNFDEAINQEGEEVDFKDIEINGNVDTSRAGVYEVKYRIIPEYIPPRIVQGNEGGTAGGMTKTATITVHENKTSIVAKDSTLNVGDTWNAKDNFISATNKYGTTIEFSDIITSGSVDTTKAGKYEITYINNGISKMVTVVVIALNNSVSVHYQDEQGNKISSSQSVSGNVGEAYDVSTDRYKLDIPGYTFKEVKGNVTGSFTSKAQTVTYIYSNKNTKDDVTPSSSSNDELDASVKTAPETKLPETGFNNSLSIILMIAGLVTILLSLFMGRKQLKK